ncbi:MAG: hypothetical protein FJW30_18860 [Acidobacteria bacterium]|nr:hypothetical protein [Acidobacteriota bacterium]
MHDSGYGQRIIPSLMGSGFPFQTAMVELVKSCEGWTVTDQEVPWDDDHRGQQFLDFVARTPRLIAAFECKKTRDEQFVFLMPNGGSRTKRVINYFKLLPIADATRRTEVFVGSWAADPESPTSKFCIIAGAGKNGDGRLLERDAQLLAGGSLSLAFVEKEKKSSGLEHFVPILPILVTNAELYTAVYDPLSISLDSGELARNDVSLSPVEFVRFSKPFLSDPKGAIGELTVFVARAAALSRLLADLADQTPGQPVNGVDRILRRRS